MAAVKNGLPAAIWTEDRARLLLLFRSGVRLTPATIMRMYSTVLVAPYIGT